MSLGVAALTTNEGIKPTDLIEEADRALYQAKKEGRNMVVMVGSLNKEN